jgi:hypothetical protein
VGFCSWALCLPGGAAGTLSGCSSAPSGRAPLDQGWVDATSPSSAAPRPPPSEARWDLAQQLRDLRPASRRARSEHLGGDLEGEILAAPGSGYPLRGPASRAAAGTTLVERMFQPGGTQPVTHFVMLKRAPGYDPPGDDWEFSVVSPDGHVEDRGPLPLCARCHAEAPHDHLFGGGR